MRPVCPSFRPVVVCLSVRLSVRPSVVVCPVVVGTPPTAHVMLGWIVGGFLASFKSLSALRYTAIAAIGIVMWTAVLIILSLHKGTKEFSIYNKYIDRGAIRLLMI